MSSTWNRCIRVYPGKESRIVRVTPQIGGVGATCCCSRGHRHGSTQTMPFTPPIQNPTFCVHPPPLNPFLLKQLGREGGHPHPLPSPRLILAFSSRVSPLPSSLVSCGDTRRVTMLFHCNHRFQLFCLHLVRNFGEFRGILLKIPGKHKQNTKTQVQMSS